MNRVRGLSLSLGRIAGIPIKVHWSFSLLLLFVGYVAYTNDIPTKDLGWFFSYVVLLFVFVIMHEYGHALTARRYGIRTRDIIISPIGGIARLESLPESPRHELLVALAGPAVNVGLAFLLLVIQYFSSDSILPVAEGLTFGSFSDFLGYLLLINIVLVVFNMVPAFPMDGGRVLRALLTMLIKDRVKATKWAVWVGQSLAVGFFILGIFWDHYMLIFIAIFVFVTARSEYRQIRLIDRMSSTYVRDIMRQHFTLLHTSDRIEMASNHPDEENFLIQDDAQNIVGALPGLYIEDAKKKNLLHLKVGEYMTPSFGILSEHMLLSSAFRILNDQGWAIAQVIDNGGNKKGVIDRQLLLDFMKSI